MGGRVLFCELKTETGILTPAQQEWGRVLSTITRVAYHVWRPAELTEILYTLST